MSGAAHDLDLVPRVRGARVRAAWGLALAFWLVLPQGCDELGNPAPVLDTPPARWEGPGVALETRTRSVPAARSNELLRQVRGSRLEHADAEARPDDVVVLVEVDVGWSSPPAHAPVPLVTIFELADGQKVQRAWTATPTRTTWYAGFALPAAPTSALTVLDR